ncbi:hypothetical protein SCUP515_06035 [Seiridium cupressi]
MTDSESEVSTALKDMSVAHSAKGDDVLNKEGRSNLVQVADALVETASSVHHDTTDMVIGDQALSLIQRNLSILLDQETQCQREVATSILVEQNKSAWSQNSELLLSDDLEALVDATEAWWTTGIHEIPQHLIEDVDENVRSLLPEGAEIVSIDHHGNSTWSRTAEIQADLDGVPVSYLIKVTDYRSGHIMYQSEYESLKANHKALPGFAPKPIGWGTFGSDPGVHFLLSEFIEMLDEPPDVTLLPPKLAELHMKAVVPDGLYGFHVPMAGGQLPVKLARSHS